MDQLHYAGPPAKPALTSMEIMLVCAGFSSRAELEQTWSLTTSCWTDCWCQNFPAFYPSNKTVSWTVSQVNHSRMLPTHTHTHTHTVVPAERHHDTAELSKCCSLMTLSHEMLKGLPVAAASLSFNTSPFLLQKSLKHLEQTESEKKRGRCKTPQLLLRSDHWRFTVTLIHSSGNLFDFSELWHVASLCLIKSSRPESTSEWTESRRVQNRGSYGSVSEPSVTSSFSEAAPSENKLVNPQWDRRTGPNTSSEKHVNTLSC